MQFERARARAEYRGESEEARAHRRLHLRRPTTSRQDAAIALALLVVLPEGAIHERVAGRLSLQLCIARRRSVRGRSESALRASTDRESQVRLPTAFAQGPSDEVSAEVRGAEATQSACRSLAPQREVEE